MKGKEIRILEFLREFSSNNDIPICNLLNSIDGSLCLIYSKSLGYIFITNGRVILRPDGSLDTLKSDDLLFGFVIKSKTPCSISRSNIDNIISIIKSDKIIEIFKKNKILFKRHNDDADNIYEYKKLFKSYLKEANSIIIEMRKRHDEDVFVYADRLSNDRYSYEKLQAAKLVLEYDKNIEQIWNKLRYEIDNNVIRTSLRVINSLIINCIEQVNNGDLKKIK